MRRYLDYFYSRGIDDSTIKAFNLGYCDSKGKPSSKEFLPFIDFRFFDKVLFPIYDLYGKLVSVSCRSIQAGEKNYIHTSYPKKHYLYGLNVTYSHIFSSNKVYIVEGNFDLLTLYCKGIKNVVAMLGSKLSLEQVSLLRRFAEELVLASDNDEAGRKCAADFTSLLKKNSVTYKVLKLPYKYDPDKYVRERGSEAFIKLEPKNFFQRVKANLCPKNTTMC